RRREAHPRAGPLRFPDHGAPTPRGRRHHRVRTALRRAARGSVPPASEPREGLPRRAPRRPPPPHRARPPLRRHGWRTVGLGGACQPISCGARRALDTPVAMASAQLAMLIDMLRSAPPVPQDMDIALRRQRLEELTSGAPLPDGVRATPVDAGGVPAEWVGAPGATDAAPLLYLHGGGYTIGSLRTHRALVGRLAAATGARALSVDYRLGPEHPFPAAVDDAVTAYRWLL